MSTDKSPDSESVQRREQRRKDESRRAEEAAAERNQPHDVADRAHMQRQSKGVHRQDGK